MEFKKRDFGDRTGIDKRKELFSDIEKNRKLGRSRAENETEGTWAFTDSEMASFARTFNMVLPIEYRADRRAEDAYSDKSYGKFARDYARKIMSDHERSEHGQSPIYSDGRPFDTYREMFRLYIENTLNPDNKKPGNFIGVEFGGQGSKLFKEFSPGFFRTTVGVCSKDVRNYFIKETDSANNHHVLGGDIFEVESDELYTKLKETVNDSKVDLIICRMIGGTGDVKSNPIIIDRVIRSWYKLLRENGMILAHPNFDDLTYGQLKVWVDRLIIEIPSIEIELDDITRAIRIYKKPGAPDEIPSISKLFK